MHILAIGVDHRSAPIELRERLACSPRQVSQVLMQAKELVQESVLISTCNRIELYVVCPEIEGGRSNLLHILSESRQVRCEEFEQYCYFLVDEQAVLHLLGVACGLYSLVPGEPQIQGQVAQALEIAQGGGYAGPVTSALFRAALGAGKRARSETGISRNAASVSYAAVQLANRLFPHLNEARILLVGSGKMSEQTAANLCDQGARQLTIINRTQANALDLAQRFGATHRSFSELAASLAEADVVITSTTAPLALITFEMMQRVVHLYNLDDLQATVDEGIHLRLQEVEQVQAIIAEEASAFDRWRRSLNVVGTISDLRRHIDTLRQQELARAMQHLSSSLTEREMATVQELTTRLMNKLLHTPMVRLKAAAAEGQGHIYAEALRYLFDLEEKIDETYNHRNTGQQTGDDTDTMGGRTATTAVAEP